MTTAFAITTHVPSHRMSDWLLARHYAPSTGDVDVDLVERLAAGNEPIEFDDGRTHYRATYLALLDAYDVDISPAH